MAFVSQTPVGHYSFEGRPSEAMVLARKRLALAALVFLLGLLVLGYRTVEVGTASGVQPTYDLPRIEVPALRLTRSDIVDRNGEVLATSLPSTSLAVNPRKIADPAAMAQKLSGILHDVAHGELLAKLSSDRGFVFLKHHLSPREFYEVNALGNPELRFEKSEERIYPHGRLAAHALGHLSRDGRGLMGLESFFDERLKNPSFAAEPLKASLDIRVQYILTEELAMAMRTYRAKAAAGMIMDARTGELVAMTSLPDFDPNTIAGTPGEERKNRLTQEVYELGSPFKTFTVAAALDGGAADMGSRWDATKPLRAARFAIHDDHPLNDELTLAEVFAFSSNIGTAQLALEIGRDRHRDFLSQLGFLDAVDVEVSERSSPLTPARWTDISTMTISYGHGLAVTPLHLVRGIAAMVNGGRLIDATLLGDFGGEPYYQQVISPRTSRQLRQLLRLAVVKGTGRRGAAKGYRVGGKTGTAEKAIGGRYDEKALISSFVGVFPMDDPKYVVFALLDEPQGVEGLEHLRSGGWTAAPVVKNTILRSAPLLGVQPRREDTSLYREVSTLIRDRR